MKTKNIAVVRAGNTIDELFRIIYTLWISK